MTRRVKKKGHFYIQYYIRNKIRDGKLCGDSSKNENRNPLSGPDIPFLKNTQKK